MPVERRSFEACPQSVSEVRRAAVRFAFEHGADEEARQGIALAVSEAASNVVVHAYRDQDRTGDIELELSMDGQAMIVAVRDDGDGMAPRPDSPGLGLGMPLIASLAETVEIRTLDTGGTEVHMRFAIGARCGAS